MTDLITQQLEAVALELEDILIRRTKLGAGYAHEFASYSADYARSLISSPDPQGAERYRNQLRAVVETIDEIGDQATEEILDRLVDGLQILIAVGKAAL